MEKGIAYGVGVGPGDPELMTLKAVRIIRENEIIAFPGTVPEESAAYRLAAQAVPEDAIRPNQLFLIALGVLSDKSILSATEELLVPGGIRSLNAWHPLYRGTYAGDEDSARKPAYHNGTAWAWPFPSFVEALAKLGVVKPDVALSLLAGAVENLNTGCLCHLSEIADGDAPHAQKGCAAQAWSDSELLRVWLKLGGK